MSNLSPALEKMHSMLSDQKQQILTSLDHHHGNSPGPEIKIKLTLQTVQQHINAFYGGSSRVGEIIPAALLPYQGPITQAIPELDVHLIAARQLPSLHGFKSVLGYIIKVKLFPGSKRFESGIQRNTWPVIDEHFTFLLAPKIKPSIRHFNSRRSNREYTPDEFFAGQFVVLTVYSLLTLQSTTKNLSNSYRSLCKKSSTSAPSVLESSYLRDDKGEIVSINMKSIGSVIYYVEPKLFQKNPGSGSFCTEEMWIPIKDITETVINAAPLGSVTQAAKGVVKLTLQLKRFKTSSDKSDNGRILNEFFNDTRKTSSPISSEIEYKMNLRQKKKKYFSDYVLYVTTSQMRCSNKVKYDLECAADNLYVKTCVFEHGVYISTWKSRFFYPSRSIKWDVGDDESTIIVPLWNINSLDQIQIRTTLETQTGIGKMVTLGVVLVGLGSSGSGKEHLWALRQTPLGERVSMWHNYQ